MEIPTNPSSPILDAGKVSVAINKLQTGQSLQATVIEKLPNKTDVILRLGSQLVQVKSDIPVTVGQSIKVLVERTATELILKAQPPNQQTSIINTSLRQLLPKQSPVNEFQQPLIQVFTRITKQTITTASSVSADLPSQLLQIKRLTRNILQSLPSQKNIITTEGFKKALQNSGVFFEAKLQQALADSKTTSNNPISNPKNLFKASPGQAQSTQNTSTTTLSPKSQQPLVTINTDLKANLIKLIHLLKAWPKASQFASQATSTQQTPPQLPLAKPAAPLQTFSSTASQTTAQPQNSAQLAAQALDSQIKELMSKADGAISKLSLNQLASSNAESNTTRQTWQIEIPFLNQHASESVFLKIQQEEPSDKLSKKADKQWTVSLEMNPPKLGLIKNKLTLNNQHISSSFWAESAETRELIHQHLSVFKDQLFRANLKPEKIQVRSGSGPTVQETKPNAPILSEKA